MMRILLMAIFILPAAALPLMAQQSAGYKLEEHVMNAGGHPENGVMMFSPGFKVSLDSIGDGVSVGGLGSASFNLDAGFVNTFRPAGEVSALMFINKDQLEWNADPSAGVYNLYRDTINNLVGLGFGACLQQDLNTASTFDRDPMPEPGDGYFYLATAENRLREEGTKGFQTTGSERQGTTCP